MQSRAFRRFSAAAGLVTACQASSIRRFLPSPSAALLSSVSARLVSTSSSNRLSAARLVCTFPTRAVLTGASALDQCRARVRARSRRRSDTRNYRTTGLQSIELAVTTPSGRCDFRKAAGQVPRDSTSFAAPKLPFVTSRTRPEAGIQSDPAVHSQASALLWNPPDARLRHLGLTGHF